MKDVHILLIEKIQIKNLCLHEPLYRAWLYSSFWMIFKHFRFFQLTLHNKKVFYSLLACAATATVYIHFNESEPLSLRLGRFLNGTFVCSGQTSPPHHPHPHPDSTVLPLQSSIQSQETASEGPEGRKGAVSDHIIVAQ